MNRIGLAVCFAAVAHLAACVTVSAPGVAQLLRVRLDDGSVLSLVPRAPAFAMKTDYANVSIPWDTLQEARVERAQWTVLLRNGDRIRGVPSEASFAGSGSLDKVQVPYEAVRSLAPCAPVPAVTSAPPVGPTHATIRMRDGSSIRGAVRMNGLRLSSRLLGTVEFTPEELLSVDFSRDPAVVGLRNGDRIVGTPVGGKVSARTELGDLRIPIDRIARIGFDDRGGAAGAAGLPEGLVAYYPLDEAGPDVRDVSGNGNDGTATGARFVEGGAVGGCFEFRGGPDAGNFIRVPHSLSLVSMQETREMTLCAWIRPRSIPRDLPVVIGKGGNEPPHLNGGYELLVNGNGDDDLHFHSNETGFLTTRAYGRLVNSRMGQWIHVAIAVESRKDGAAFAFHVNAQRSPKEGIDGDHLGVNANFDIPVDLYIGGPDPRHHPNRAFFDGWIDEVMIFNRKLTGEEIRGLYERRTEGRESSGEQPSPMSSPEVRPPVKPSSPIILRRT